MEENYYFPDGEPLEINARIFSVDFDNADVQIKEEIEEEINNSGVDEEEASMYGF